MDDRRSPTPSEGGRTDPPAGGEEPSLELVRRAQRGDYAALELLLGRYLPRMRRWARGRLPVWARLNVDTDDMVQDALIRTCERLGEFEPRGDGALQAYLRQALRNRITDEVRKSRHRPVEGEVLEARPDDAPSPLEEAIGAEAVEAYERALASLTDAEREGIIARVEMGMSYAEIAAALGKPSVDAARMAVGRALLRLAEGMGHGEA
jgi:RNA polymerase sigma factor (sigma-70 family)